MQTDSDVEMKEQKEVLQPSTLRQRSLDADFDNTLLHYLTGFIAAEKIVEKKVADEKKEVEKEYIGDLKMIGRLATMNKRFHGLFKVSLNAERDKRLLVLMKHIMQGERDQVKAILEKSPSLLSHTLTVKNPAGYIIKATPYRAALCGWDPQMAEIIQKYLDPKEAKAEWDTQFPTGWEEEEAKRWAPLFDQLKVLDKTIQAADEKDITSDPNYKLTVKEHSTVAMELAKFHSLLEATKASPIETGRAFNPHFIQAVANLYDRYRNDFDYDNPKRLLCWQRVFGYTQRFLGVSDAGLFIDWLNTSKLENNKPQNRNLTIEVWDHAQGRWVNSSFFAVDSCLVLIMELLARGPREGWAACGRAGECVVGLEILYQSKTSAFRKLTQRFAVPLAALRHDVRCAVM